MMCMKCPVAYFRLMKCAAFHQGVKLAAGHKVNRQILLTIVTAPEALPTFLFGNTAERIFSANVAAQHNH